MDDSFPIEKKYLTKACSFYRKNLKRKVNGEILEKKDYENPNEIIEFENIENNYPEFEQYIIKSKVIHDGKLQIINKNKNKKQEGDTFINLPKNLQKNENIIESSRPLQDRDQCIDEEEENEEHKPIAKQNKEEEDDIEGIYDIV